MNRKTKPAKHPYEILTATVRALKRSTADNETIKAVAKAAAGCAPLPVREKFARKDANKLLADWCRNVATQVADKKRDISEIRLWLDAEARTEGRPPEYVQLMRGTLAHDRGEIVRCLLRAATKAETTGVSEHELQRRISSHLHLLGGEVDE